MPKTLGDLTLYSVEEIAEQVGVQPRYVRDRLKKGYLKGNKFARRWYVTEESLRAYFESGSQEEESEEDKDSLNKYLTGLLALRIESELESYLKGVKLGQETDSDSLALGAYAEQRVSSKNVLDAWRASQALGFDVLSRLKPHYQEQLDKLLKAVKDKQAKDSASQLELLPGESQEEPDKDSK